MNTEVDKLAILEYLEKRNEHLISFLSKEISELSDKKTLSSFGQQLYDKYRNDLNEAMERRSSLKSEIEQYKKSGYENDNL